MELYPYPYSEVNSPFIYTPHPQPLPCQPESTHLNICSFQCQHLYGTLFAPISCSCAENAFSVLFGTNQNYICFKFNITIQKINAGTASSKGAIWNEFSSNISIKALKRAPYKMLNWHFLVQIRCRFNAHLSWAIWNKRLNIIIYYSDQSHIRWNI